MWFETPQRAPDWAPAIRHLRRDPVMRGIIQRVGPCTLHPRRDYFVVLCKSIFTQQISTAVATTLFGRFRELFPMRRPTPARVVAALTNGNAQALRGCGLSRQKHSYLLDLSQRFVAGQVPTRKFAAMTDEQIIESLVQVKGIGRWTAEMFLIFVLNRPDVLPVDDLGLREGAKRFYRLSERPRAAELTALGERWRPWRTVATWYLWRGLSAIPPVPLDRDESSGEEVLPQRRRGR
jgi:DNA-3-methyladenine glycosylase II